MLFEDELGDNGEAKLNVKVRVMPSGFFALSRFYMRVDDVIVRIYETRIHYEQGNNFMLRESTKRECVYSQLSSQGIKLHEVLQPDEIASKLPLVEEVFEKLQYPNHL